MHITLACGQLTHNCSIIPVTNAIPWSSTHTCSCIISINWYTGQHCNQCFTIRISYNGQCHSVRTLQCYLCLCAILLGMEKKALWFYRWCGDHAKVVNLTFRVQNSHFTCFTFYLQYFLKDYSSPAEYNDSTPHLCSQMQYTIKTYSSVYIC